MQSVISIQNEPDRYVISIDKKSIDQDFLLDLLETIQLEQLARKIDFDDSIMDLAEEINANWWQKNKERFIQE